MKVTNRHTKIIATLGPASSNLATIGQMIEAGVNVFRLNFSHGDHAFHQQLIVHIREASAKLGIEVGILADLQGPKIRIGDIEGGEVMIRTKEVITITTNPNKKGEKVFFTPVSTFAKDVQPGEKVLIDDGLLELKALEKDDDESVRLEVIYGGLLKSRKGMNLPQTKLSIPSYTEKDLKDLTFIVTQDIDFVALSFVRTAKDIEEFQEAMLKLGRTIPIIAKIEKPEALENVEAIVELCYGVMIARGDLGVEVPPEQVPFEQKRIARHCNQVGKPVIIATQILESMVTKAVPTRAEANDVANAVLDGGDGLMLSAETAAGVDPVRCVATMARIMKTVEDQFINGNQFKRYLFKDYMTSKMPDALCYSAVKLGVDLEAKLISCVTKTGTTALHFARHRVAVPLLAITDSKATIRKMSLSWGIECSLVKRLYNAPECLDEIIQTAEEFGKLKTGDLIVVTLGLPDFTFDHTNTIKVHYVNREGKSSFI